MENVLGHACMMADAEFIDVRDLPDYLRDETAARRPANRI
jgi:transcriptional regulator of acetoin/glycerol metabolism